MEYISQPWHWSISGLMITFVMFLLIYLGHRFGVSSSFKAICAVGGAGKKFDYFNYDWKNHDWLLVFIVGAAIGGFIASSFLSSDLPVQISEATVQDLAAIGVATPTSFSEGSGFLPTDIFSIQNLSSLQGIIIMVLGGFLIGFGTRYAGGCTSGHAISGLSNLQMPSLVAVLGFFIGGLAMTFIFLPLILNL